MAGPTPTALALAEAPPAWVALGFAVDPAGVAQVGGVALRLGDGPAGWTLADAGAGERPDALDGIATTWEPPGTPRPVAPVHPNGALEVDHVVVATPDLPRTLRALEAAGMAVRRRRDAGTPERPLRQAFLRHGPCVVEVVGPRTAAGTGPARLWGLTVTVADIDAASALLGPALGAPRDAVQPGRRIATVRRAAGIAIPLALMSA